MSDFFMRLAQRALGLAPTLQPSIPSMFAQAVQAADEGLFETIAEVDLSASPDRAELPIQPTQSRSIVPTDQQAMASSLAQQRASTPTSNFSAEHTNKSAFAASPQSAMPSTSPANLASKETIHVAREVLQPAQENQRDLSFSQSQPVFFAMSEAFTSPLSNAGMSLDTKSVHLHTSAETPLEAQSSHLHAEEPHTTIMPVQEKIVYEAGTLPLRSEPSYKPAPQSVQMRTNRARVHTPSVATPRTTIERVSEQHVEHKPTGDVSPTIHVTIGRIEVRAIPPAPTTTAVPRQSNGPIVKSLDDYLQQRAKGGH